MLFEEIQHDVVNPRSIAMQIQRMAHIRLDISFEGCCFRKGLLDASRNGWEVGSRAS